MIGHSCELACEINPIRRDPQLRRPCHGRSSMKHTASSYKKDKKNEKKGSTCRTQKKALLSAFSDLSSVDSSDEIRERYPPEEYS